MTSIVWQTKVFEDDQTSYTLYHFENRQDVLNSIKTTWSRTPDAIKIEELGPRNGQIIVKDANNGKLLVEASAIVFELLKNSTHF